MTDGKDLVVLASLKVLVVDLNDRGAGHGLWLMQL
jgi:hypothetical protein